MTPGHAHAVREPVRRQVLRRARALQERRPRWPRPFRARGRDIVVLYHRIAEDSDDPGGMVVTPARFRKQLTALREVFDVVPAAEVLAGRSSRQARPRAAITFDDGYADNLHAAFPVLRELGLPAAMFLVTDGLGSDREFWWDRLEHLVLEDLAPLSWTVRIGSRRRTLALVDDQARRAALAWLSRVLMQQPPDTVEGVLRSLQQRADTEPVSCPRHSRLTRQDVLTLAGEDLVEIGSHTCTHAPVGRLTRDACRAELVESRQALAALTGVRPRLLAYPFGAPGTVRRRDARLAADVGYDLAFTNVPAPVEGASPFAVPRISVGDWDTDAFLARLRRWEDV